MARGWERTGKGANGRGEEAERTREWNVSGLLGLVWGGFFVGSGGAIEGRPDMAAVSEPSDIRLTYGLDMRGAR